MEDNDVKRLSRLTAILIQLQSKNLVTATSLSKKFNVSVRTIYRDIKALQQSGIPIITDEGKGYSIFEGFRIPPVMFTEREAYALLTMEQIILKQKDSSLVKEATEAVAKIKAVMRSSSKEKMEVLEKRMFIGKNWENQTTSRSLIDLQFAITGYRLLQINYINPEEEITTRIIEPFSIYHSGTDDWLLVAYCRLRKDFRIFRIDRIKKIITLDEQFPPHNMTLQQFVKNYLK